MQREPLVRGFVRHGCRRQPVEPATLPSDAMQNEQAALAGTANLHLLAFKGVRR